MRIAAIGGRGFIGARLVSILRTGGHEAVAASPSSGIDAVTGTGVAEALAAVQVVVDVAESPSLEDQAALEFFVTPANPVVTPAEIVPEWYYLPFYAILRAIPNKLLGVIALFGSIGVLAFLPWLDTSRVRSARYRPLFAKFFWLFVITCIGLGWLGTKPPEGVYLIVSRLLTFYYFAFFLLVLPALGLFEKTLPLPKSISESVLHSARK